MLQKADFPVVSKRPMQQLDDRIFLEQICAGYEEGRADICVGAPLAYTSPGAIRFCKESGASGAIAQNLECLAVTLGFLLS